MAAAGPVRDLQDEATCSICLEYFKDPVMVDCGHNFCRSCITECWEGSATNFSCPQCRETSKEQNLRPNRQLGNMVEMLKKFRVPAVKAPEPDLCQKHEEKLKLFCKDDQMLICVVCSMSQDHKSHNVSPIEEAAQEYKVKLQDWLHPLKKEMEEILKSKLKEEEEYKTLRKKLESERQKIAAEFKGLFQHLRKQEQTLLRRLEEMDKNITMVENANITKLCHQMTSLSALITEIEEKCKEPAGELLKDVRSTLSRCNNVKFRKPQKTWMKITKGLTGVDNLKVLKPEEIKKYKVLVTLDPDTAHPRLVLSEGRRRVRDTETAQTLTYNAKRFTGYDNCVLGSEGFTSGRYYWELQILQDGAVWDVGVAAESVPRKGDMSWSPAGGVWAISQVCDGHYCTRGIPDTPLDSRKRIKKLGVYLEYEGRRLSLYNADFMELLCTFTQASFTHRIFPFFHLSGGAEIRLV